MSRSGADSPSPVGLRGPRTPLKSPPPLVTNDAAVVLWGTAIWVVALISALLARGWLRQHDALWWIWVAVAGVAFGLTWGPYAMWKRRSFLTEHHLRDDDDVRPPGAP